MKYSKFHFQFCNLHMPSTKNLKWLGCSPRFNWKIIIIYSVLDLVYRRGTVSKTEPLKCLLPWILLCGLSSDISACHSHTWVMSFWGVTAKYASLLLFAMDRQWILFPLNEIKYLKAVTYCRNLNEWSFFWKQMQAEESRDSKWVWSCHRRKLCISCIQALWLYQSPENMEVKSRNV